MWAATIFRLPHTNYMQILPECTQALCMKRLNSSDARQKGNFSRVWFRQIDINKQAMLVEETSASGAARPTCHF